MKITVISGGVGGARFLRGVRAHVREAYPDGDGGSTASVTAVVNTGDDMWLSGLRIAPDLDSIMYTLAGESDEVRGWGRVGETERVSGELRAYGVGWPWFTLGDLDIGTHLARTSMLRDGLTLAEATARITSRWPLGVRLLPATNDEVETHVVVGDGTSMHFQEWWTRHRATLAVVRSQHRTRQIETVFHHSSRTPTIKVQTPSVVVRRHLEATALEWAAVLAQQWNPAAAGATTLVTALAPGRRARKASRATTPADSARG